MIQNIIFDFDGTLADTTEGIVRTTNRALRELGLPERSSAEIRRGIGLPLKGSLKVGAEIPDELLDEAVLAYRRVFDEEAPSVIVLYPGIKEALAAFAERGLRMAIATSRSSRSLVMLLSMLGIDSYFEDLATVEVAAHPKPAPDTVLYLLDRMNIKPEETLVVGDTTFDLEMGQRAGCRVCGVSWGNQSAGQLATCTPDGIAADADELKRFCLSLTDK